MFSVCGMPTTVLHSFCRGRTAMDLWWRIAHFFLSRWLDAIETMQGWCGDWFRDFDSTFEWRNWMYSLSMIVVLWSVTNWNGVLGRETRKTIYLCLNEDQDWLRFDDTWVLSNSGAMTVCVCDILQDVMGTRFWISAQDRVDWLIDFEMEKMEDKTRGWVVIGAVALRDNSKRESVERSYLFNVVLKGEAIWSFYSISPSVGLSHVSESQIHQKHWHTTTDDSAVPLGNILLYFKADRVELEIWLGNESPKELELSSLMWRGAWLIPYRLGLRRWFREEVRWFLGRSLNA